MDAKERKRESNRAYRARPEYNEHRRARYAEQYNTDERFRTMWIARGLRYYYSHREQILARQAGIRAEKRRLEDAHWHAAQEAGEEVPQRILRRWAREEEAAAVPDPDAEAPCV